MTDKNSQNLAPGLWIVATPLGNLMDMSPRAEMALKRAHVVLCEDTRRTAKLMSALQLEKTLVRFDQHATSDQIERICDRIQAGESLALVSDAGTPAVSDPAARLVARAHQKGIQVTGIPGPCAPVLLLSVAGFDDTSFVFRGFFPRKKKDALEELGLAKSAISTSRVWIWFESPERVVDSLEIIQEFEANAEMVCAKELTKIHEKIFAGSTVDVYQSVSEEIKSQGKLGEWCFAVRFVDEQVVNASENSLDSSEWVKTLQCLLNVRVSASDAAREISSTFKVSKNSVYEMALKLSGKK